VGPGSWKFAARCASNRSSKGPSATFRKIVALDKVQLTKRFGKIPLSQFALLIAGINLVLGK
jgi:hypothetical protein